MPHDVSLIAILAAGFGLAMIFGFIAARLRMPPLVGYLLAGIVIGPATPGFVADVGLAGQLAEIGVMLLMFGVGLHFSLEDLMSVRRIAVPGAIVQIAVAVALGMGVALWWGWSPGGALVFGLCLSVASTVVLLRALETRGILSSINGNIAVGWLIVEDLVMVLVLVLLPALSGVLGAPEAGATPADSGALWQTLAITLAKVVAFIAFMLLVGRRVLPRVLWFVARTGSQELFTLSVLAVAIGFAFGAAKLFDVSFALGAFFAGMMMRESEFSHRAADESLPLRDAFAVLFFVSVGMLFDPAVVWNEPGKLVATVAIILVGKTVAAVAIVLLFRYPLNTALTVGASLAQIGEFSFILAGLGVALGLLPPEGQSLVLAGALVSIALNAATFVGIAPMERLLRGLFPAGSAEAPPSDPLCQLSGREAQAGEPVRAVLIGHGRVGRRISRALREQGVRHVVVDQNRERVDDLRKDGLSAVYGDAESPDVQRQAHVPEAALLVIAVPDTVGVRQMIATAKTLNPGIAVVARTHNAEEAALFEHEGLATVFLGERELARNMVADIQRRLT